MPETKTQTFSAFAALPAADVLRELGSSQAAGLAEAERGLRLKKYGYNELRQASVQWHVILIRQFKSSFVYLLFAAAAISLLLGEIIDGISILLFVAINASLGFYQEYRSEQTVQMLRVYTRAQAKVLISGKQESRESRSLVPGDIINLEAGDLVPADIRLLVAHNLSLDESALTGESVPVAKSHQALAQTTRQIYQASSIAFSGTTVASGYGTGAVIATGSDSVMGEVSKLASELPRESAFEKSLAGFSSFILRLVIVTIVFMFAANLAIKHDGGRLAEFLVFSVALAVSVIPEALPVVTTFSLSRGALRLARHKVVVKRLSAIEDLGSIEVLCTDKTGTLTENKLAVAEVFGVDRELTLAAAALASSYFSPHETQHDAFDLAVWEALSPESRNELRSTPRLDELPFDPERKRNSVLLQAEGEQRQLLVRGAPEPVIESCRFGSAREAATVRTWTQEQGRQGRRVIAIARKQLPVKINYGMEQEAGGLQLVGCLAFSDPIKSTTIPALKRAERLGITIKILTGDSREVAGSVAHQIGLIRSPAEVITGEELEALPAPDQPAAADKFHVFARVSPQQKYRIIQLLESKHLVGFLGEGINDAPALKMANVALVVSGAADVAREASDIILLKKSLQVIVDGIQEGREVFANTIKYIRATLAANFGNFYAIAIASLLIDFLPMLPLQILLVNLLSDFPMIAVATDSVDPDDTRKPRGYRVGEIAWLAILLGITSTIDDFIFFAVYSPVSPAALQTNWFIGSILTELVFIFSIRTKFFFLKTSPPSHILVALCAIAAVATIILPFLPIGASVFHFEPPRMSYLMIDLGLVALFFVATEVVKLLYYRFANNKTG